MSFTPEALYELLPAIYRIRDAEQGEPLKQFLAVIAEQAGVIEENLDQLYDDQFIETCADWVTPYIGDLIGYRSLHGVAPRISSPRADVANTITRRRRKGTAAMLEQLAWDVTGWRARAVEFFQLLATTQYMNHIRPDNRLTPDLGNRDALERLGTPFDPVAHTLDVRSIASRRGRYNIPNIGLFLWRLRAFSVSDSPAAPVGTDTHRYRFSPLGNDTPLFTRSEPENEITHLAEPINVPAPIRRRVLDGHLDDYYGDDKSLLLEVDGDAWPKEAIDVCDLSGDDEAGWAHAPAAGRVAIDPVLGRIAFPPSDAQPEAVRVSFHYGFSNALGGGEYDRAGTLSVLDEAQGQEHLTVSQAPNSEATHSTIQAALEDIPAAGGIVEIADSGRYEEDLRIEVGPEASVELRAKHGCRPTILLAPRLEIRGGIGSAVALNGLLLAVVEQENPTLNALVRVSDTEENALRVLRIRHCTIVPGQSLHSNGAPQRPRAPSLDVSLDGMAVQIEQSIVGGLRIHPGSTAAIEESVVDATDATGVAFGGPVEVPLDDEDDPPGGTLTLDDCTVIGKVHSVLLERVSSSILHGRLREDDPRPAPVRAERRQEGCLRFSFVPHGSIGPRRFRCQPDLAIAAEVEKAIQEAGGEIDAAARAAIVTRVTAAMAPSFTSTQYGDPGYAQLRHSCPVQIRTGAEDEAEMGLFRKLYQPQRETNLRVRLEEYLRFGLEAGIFYET